jgi:hypothetical protein
MSGRKKEERYAAPVNHESLPHFDPRPAARVAASILRKVGAPHAIIGRVAKWTYLPPDDDLLPAPNPPVRLNTYER